jgi:predicted nuclease of predicted toxin-antitoxin system
VKFLIDMPLSPELATWLRLKQHDARHALEMGLDRAADADIMALAQKESRTVVKADLDYARLLALGSRSGPSVILFRDGTWSDAEVIERMTQLLEALIADEIEQRSSVIVSAVADCRSPRAKPMSKAYKFCVAPMMEWTDRAEKQSAISIEGELDKPCCYQTLCRPFSKREQANDGAFPPSFGGCRISQRTTPICDCALPSERGVQCGRPSTDGW